LIKGARSFGLEQVVAILEEKVHETRLEIDLQAVVHNYNQYRQRIKPDTKIMAMVKAFAYGSGATEIAHVLQFQGVDYFGVAYADEGVELRKAGITTPIMVMNTEPAAFETLLTYQLEPALYSVALLDSFDQFLQQQGITNYPIHLEIETGMNRLGLTEAEWPLVIKRLTSTASFLIQSVFSHLAASEDAAADSFTNEQFAVYNSFIRLLTSEVDARFIRHIANSAGAIRHPSLVMDMVRVGIGLYGIEKSSLLTLKPAITFRSTIAQIKIIPAGSGVSYNRKTVVERPTRLATVRVGYADGYPRSLGNRKGYVWVQEKLAPILGTVCMDMFMIDVTDIPTAQVGDEVILFGKELPVEQVAHWTTTIPYEILTGISQRVKRVYFQD
jgi:alanine racemase